MSVHAAGVDHRVYVFAAVLTHAALGYTVASVCTDRGGVAGAVGGVLPDVDLLFAPGWPFPFVHRGVTHTLVFAALVVGVLWYAADARHAAPATALGLLSHLLVDSFTRSGVMWLYPLSVTPVGVAAAVHSLEPSLFVWSLLLSGLYVDRRRSRRGD